MLSHCQLNSSERHDRLRFAIIILTVSPPLSPLNSVTFVLLGVGIPAMLPKEGKKNSKYISMIEGRHGKLDHGDSHAHH